MTKKKAGKTSSKASSKAIKKAKATQKVERKEKKKGSKVGADLSDEDDDQDLEGILEKVYYFLMIIEASDPHNVISRCDGSGNLLTQSLKNLWKVRRAGAPMPH